MLGRLKHWLNHAIWYCWRCLILFPKQLPHFFWGSVQKYSLSGPPKFLNIFKGWTILSIGTEYVHSSESSGIWNLDKNCSLIISIEIGDYSGEDCCTIYTVVSLIFWLTPGRSNSKKSNMWAGCITQTPARQLGTNHSTGYQVCILRRHMTLPPYHQV